MLKSVSSGKLYVANAGDSRAVLCRLSRAYPMSYDFTPVTERQRLQTIGRLQPHLLGGYLVNSVSDPLFFSRIGIWIRPKNQKRIRIQILAES